ncbi:hypothetical protein BKP42_61740 [Rhodococcus erythropolis]|uniref:hypothetical protein n=1 Tax=Rhodococcus erythropolis TaxID=1833 RepID=UPI00117A50C4|nr:hypothetical protein [Rhodococcus erythropolis]PBI87610.1 hypothetical protein BKP42_61740 [Rhodococcus erythropolis]
MATVGALFQNSVGVKVAIIGAVCVVVGTLCASRQNPSYASLLRRHKELADESLQRADVVKDLLRLILADISRELDIGPDGRSSVYVHDARAFVMCARHSADPTLERPGRGFYPEDQGVIGMAWQSGSRVVTLPDPSTPEYMSDLTGKYGFDTEAAGKLTMTPRSILAIRYPVEPTLPPLGVLVIESSKHRKFSNGAVDDVKNTNSWATLTAFLSTRSGDLPKMSKVAQEGF